jgi:hypothetical protein
MDFTSSITLQFNDLFSAGFSQAYNSLLEMQSTLNSMTSDGLVGIQSGIAGVKTELGGIDYKPIVGIGETAAGVSAPLGEMRSSLEGITGQGIGAIKNDISALGSALDTINPAPPVSEKPQPVSVHRLVRCGVVWRGLTDKE